MERIRLLVVEDDVALAKAMARALSDYEYEVSVVHRVSDAIERLAGDSFHVLIADWILERQLGKVIMEFARTAVPELPIICFSAHVTTDSECSHWADEFVLKCSTGADRLRSAIVRRLNSQRQRTTRKESTNGNSFPVLSCIPKQVMETINVGLGKSLLCWSELHSLGRDFLLQLIQSNHPGTYIEIDCAHPEFGMSQLIGRCELAGERSKLVRGHLDTVQPYWCVMLNVDALKLDEQEQLAAIIATRQVQRKGSTRSIPLDCFVGLSANRSNGICKELLAAVTQEIHLPSPKTLFRRSLESDLPVSAREKKDAVSKVVSPRIYDACWPFANRTEGLLQSIGPRVLVELILNVGNDSERKKSWKDVERITKVLYLGQVLGETNGNVSLAAKWSGLRRNAIYDLLREFELTPQAFRQNKSSINLKT